MIEFMSIIRAIFGLALLPALASAASQPQPLSAIMTFESKVLSSEGVEKQTRFQERLIRDGRNVWTVRLLPAGTPPHVHQAGDHQHKHDTNFVLAAKWIALDAQQKAQLKFVRQETKTIITPRTEEFAGLGFDGSWEHAAYLLDRSALQQMRVLNKPAPAGCQWYERSGDKLYTRVLWDQAWQLPRQIETGSLDGLSFNRISIERRPMPATMPWRTLAGYRAVAYEDLLD